MTELRSLAPGNVARRADALFQDAHQRILVRTDRLFAGLMTAQWLCAILLAVFVTPYTWSGATRSMNIHVLVAVVLGGIITVFPVALAIARPGWWLTRHVIAVAQMLWSALLIHLSGGRVETHFHVFGSLTFLAFYRDFRVLIPATLVVALDHFLRGFFWPQSVYGLANPEWWRFIEHAFWVVYIDLFLVMSCIQSMREMRAVSLRQAEVEALSASERQKSEAIDSMVYRIEEQRAVLAAQSEASVEGVLVMSGGGKVLSFNRRFLDIWDIPAEVMAADVDGTGSTHALLTAAAAKLIDPEVFEARVSDLYAQPNQTATDEIRFRDGRIVECCSVPLRTAEGHHFGRAWYFRDLTARVQAEAQVRALNAELERRVEERTSALAAANRNLAASLAELRETQGKLILADRLVAVGRLSAGIAHELNNPLSFVMTNLSFLEQQLANGSTGDANELRSAAGEALQGAERLRRIVGDLKVFARADEDRRERADLHAILDSGVKMAANEIRHRGRLIRDYGPVPSVMGDAGRLGQVFLNLLINAAHALTGERVEGNEIRVCTFTDAQGRAVVEIADTGEGIRPEIQGRLFDPFFTTKPIGVGTGLGLSICHGIVTAHGGEISVESVVGVGSCFRVVLPGAPAQRRPDPAAPAAAARERVARRRILIVDDEASILSATRRVLALDHDVEASGSGRHALERMRRGERYDVILCDLMMPEMTGMDVYRELERLHPDQAGRIIFLTGGAFTTSAQEFLAGIKNQLVEKPFDVAKLSRLVAAATPAVVERRLASA